MPTPTFRLKSLAVTALLLAVMVGPSAHGAAGAGADLGSMAVAGAETLQSNGKTLSEAVAEVRRQYGGRIISAETQRRGNREVHVIKVLTQDNKVKTVRVQGRSLNRGG